MSAEAPLSLVTGACGFMGSHMLEVLHEAGHRIRATDLAEAYDGDDLERGRFPSVARRLGVEFVPSDMTRPETLPPVVEGVDYVFHVASIFSYLASWEALEAVNVKGTRRLCELLLKEKRLKRLVLWGAGGVYGFPRSPEDLPITEDMAPDPPNDYLKSKWSQEFLVMEMGRREGLPFAIMRPTGVYGPRCVYGMGQVIRDLAGMKVVAAPRNFDFRVPLVHVEDVVRAALFLADCPQADGEVYNLNDDGQLTNLEFMELVAIEMGHRFAKLPPVPIVPMRFALWHVAAASQLISKYVTGKPSKLEAPSIEFLGRDFTYSNAKLKGAGYKFVYPDSREGLRQSIRWYIAQGWI